MADQCKSYVGKVRIVQEMAAFQQIGTDKLFKIMV